MNIKNVLVRAIVGAVIGWSIGQFFNWALSRCIKTLGDHKNLTMADKDTIQNFLDTDPFLNGTWNEIHPDTKEHSEAIAEVARQALDRLNAEEMSHARRLADQIKSGTKNLGSQLNELLNIVRNPNAREYELLREMDMESESYVHPSQRIGNGWDDLNLSPTPEQSAEDIKNHGAF